LRDFVLSVFSHADSLSAKGSSLPGRSGTANFGSIAPDFRYFLMVFRKSPVRRAISRIGSFSRSARRRMRVYPERLVIAAEGQILCAHARRIDRSHHLPTRMIYDWRHYLTVIQRKPGALRNGAPFAELPHAFRQLREQMLKRPGGDREMVDILALVLHHDERVVLTAVELALSEGIATKTHALNTLHRLIDGKSVNGPTINTPQVLLLRREPKADVGRYDNLCARSTGGRHAS
jgi:hypothetical protein